MHPALRRSNFDPESVIPYKRYIPSVAHLNRSEIASFASILSEITVRFDNLFTTSFAYSMGIHQLPTLGAHVDYPDAQLHVHFSPPLLRSASVRKFLVGFELMSEPQRDLTPEQAAARLRGCASIHYLAQQS
jgi:UDPglucose--hexose-1-phosphate uridylyltransferase